VRRIGALRSRLAKPARNFKFTVVSRLLFRCLVENGETFTRKPGSQYADEVE
jgi:hypothetical protein